ncbi:MAG: LarC family nickel insertion protein, partial [Gemmataceae bacterium]|nr:LarC family nickel insertion protein [Gemmataceae bacterium]
LMPVPAPGTAALLRGVPLRPSSIKAELTTPTGAAILTTIVDEWVEQPVLTIERIGHGAGRREFVEQPNLLRVFVGTAAEAHGAQPVGFESDQVWVLETNLDDLPAEVIGYCYDLLLAAGALDVYAIPIFMKKNRPGVLLSVLAPAEKVGAVEAILFRETTTLGVRRYPVSRHKLHRRPHSVETPWGPVHGKLGWQEGRPPVFAPEYEDCARLARQHGIPLREIYARAQQAYESATDQRG